MAGHGLSLVVSSEGYSLVVEHGWAQQLHDPWAWLPLGHVESSWTRD